MTSFSRTLSVWADGTTRPDFASRSPTLISCDLSAEGVADYFSEQVVVTRLIPMLLQGAPKEHQARSFMEGITIMYELPEDVT
eukprot:5924744-Pyramimonas_sp.AAC.1